MADEGLNGTWSLGCDIAIEDENSNIQQYSVDDIILEGSVVTEELSVNIDHDRINVMDLDINVIVDGLNTAIAESQIVPYESILNITDNSPESTAEKKFASSARASKILHNFINAISLRVEKLENTPNVPGGGGSGNNSANSEEIKALLKLLDWFELDPETNLIRANHGLYSVGPITALGRSTDSVFPNAVNRLANLRDVRIDSPKEGQTLVYDSEQGIWENAQQSGIAGGDATLTSDIKTDVSVGYISKNYTLPEGMTFTEFVELMFSQGIKTIKPTVSISGVPSKAIEVGTEITLDLSSTYKDGYFVNTDEGTTKAGCTQEDATYYFNGNSINIPHKFTASEPMVHTIEVRQPYGASTVKPVKGGEEKNEVVEAGVAIASDSFTVGYRAFWGYMTDSEAEAITSSSIRSLEHADIIINPNATSITLLSSKFEIPGGQDIIIAVPEGYVLSEVTDEDGDFSKAFISLPDVVVNCAGFATKKYKVYRFDNGTPYSMEIISIVIRRA